MDRIIDTNIDSNFNQIINLIAFKAFQVFVEISFNFKLFDVKYVFVYNKCRLFANTYHRFIRILN